METTSAVIDSDMLVEQTTKSAAIAEPVLDTFGDLTIYISAICGTLGAFLIFAAIGWILDQCEVFGDPIGRQIVKLRKKKRASRVHSNVYPRAIPRANQETESRDFPAWVYRTENQPDATGEYNDAFDNLDHLNESMKAQQKAAKHLERICSDLEEELSDSDNETDDGNDDSREHDISPSAIAAYEKNKARGGHGGLTQGLRMSGRLSQEMLNQLTSPRTFKQITPRVQNGDEPTPRNPYEPSTTTQASSKQS